MMTREFKFRMTWHAVRRFGERVLDLDGPQLATLTEAAVAELVPRVVRLAIQAGCSKITSDGITYIAARGRVVTVLGRGMAVSRHRGVLS